MHFDFNVFLNQYKNLDAKWVTLLNSFFQDSEVQKIIETIEEQTRKKMLLTWTIVGLIILLLCILFESWKDQIQSWMLVIFWAAVSIPLVFFMVNGVCKFLWGDTAKDVLLPKFVKKIEPDMTYKKSPDTAFWKTEFLDGTVSKNILSRYDRLDRFEDTIAYEIKNASWVKAIELSGVEVRTSRRSGGKKKTRHTNNHAYLIKIKFLNPKNTLAKAITLNQDFNDKPIFKFIGAWIITLIVFFVLASFLAPVVEKNGQYNADIGAYFSSLDTNWIIVLVMSMGSVFFGIQWIIHSFMNRSRVKMENLDFEKRFDVFCEDPQEARELLTPSFMYRILDYIAKIDNKRVYTFYFKEDYVFIKYDIKASMKTWVMEISALKSIKNSLDDYVKFYLEVQWIKSLIEDLRLAYYDKNIVLEKLVAR